MQADWSQLQALTLVGQQLSGVVSELSTWPPRHQITSLSFSSCHLSGTDIQSLGVHDWQMLRRLYMRDDICDCQILEICRAGSSTIEELDLSHCCTSWERSDDTLLDSIWPALQVLKMPAAGIDDVAMSQLAKVTCPNLQAYDLTANIRTPGMMQHLVSCSYQMLTYLNLSWSDLDVSGVQELVQGNWPQLSMLDLSGNGLCIDAVTDITACRSWPLLRQLNLSRNWLARCGAIKLRSGNTLQLKLLAVSTGTMPEWVQLHWPNIEWVDVSDGARLDSSW